MSKLRFFRTVIRGKKCCRGLYDDRLSLQEKYSIVIYNFARIFKNFQDFPRIFSCFSGLEFYHFRFQVRGLLPEIFSHAEGWNCRLGRLDLDATHDMTELGSSITITRSLDLSAPL